MLFWKLVGSMLGVLAITTFVGGTVLADSAGSKVDESASPRLADTGTISPQIKSFARHQLQVDEGVRLSLWVAAPVDVNEVDDNGLYDLWVTTQHGNPRSGEDEDEERERDEEEEAQDEG